MFGEIWNKMMKQLIQILISKVKH